MIQERHLCVLSTLVLASVSSALAQGKIPSADDASVSATQYARVADPNASGPIEVSEAMQPVRLEDGRIQVGDVIFDTWIDYHMSEYFQRFAIRCGTLPPSDAGPRGDPSDCGFSNTNPSAEYAPGVKYRIPVVVHCLRNTNGDGYISHSNALGQIAILNEDFQALPGTNGGSGLNVKFEFYLATKDPNNLPTTGVTYNIDNGWFNEQTNSLGTTYWDALAWDTSRYLNIYTLDIANPTVLGRVFGFPADPSGGLGTKKDGVNIRWSVFGPESLDPVSNLGRTATHEIGHYFGLYHPFQSGCNPAATPGCYTTGDCICDTPPESMAHFGCTDSMTCGDPDAYHNYMAYSDDECMMQFTQEQARRMRCTLLNYRQNLYSIADPNAGACCRLDASCSVVSPEDCFSIAGVFRGQGITCGGSTCTQSITATDTCTNAQIMNTGFSHSGTTTGRANDYDSTNNTCGDLYGPESGHGPDVVYGLNLPGGGTVNVRVTPTDIADLSVYAVEDCSNPGGTCKGGDDRGSFGDPEEFTFTADPAKTYYIIVDVFDTGVPPFNAGPYNILVSVSGSPSGACCLPNGACDIGSAGACLVFGGAYKGNGSSCATANCPQPPASGACCDENGDCFVSTEAFCLTSAGSFAGDFTVCTPSPCADPFGACCGTDDACTETLKTLCVAEGGTFLGVNTECSAPLCADIPGACCLNDGTCVSLKGAECAAMDGLFKGRARKCANVNCPQPTGACCTTDAPCAIRTQAACDGEGGDYKGNQTACKADTCPAPEVETLGACCKTDGSCDDVEKGVCDSAGGTYRGNGISCESATCPQPTGACCFGGGACSVISQTACESATGTFAGDGSNCATGCSDACPGDPDKTTPGICGCGVADVDSDGDGTLDCRDECPDDPKKTKPGECGCGNVEQTPCDCTPMTDFCGNTTPCMFGEFLVIGFGIGVTRRRQRRRR